MSEVGLISASKLTTYYGCPFAYYLHYEKHVKVPSSIYLVFGKTIHYMINKFYRQDYKSEDSFAGQFSGFYWFNTVFKNYDEVMKGLKKKGASEKIDWNILEPDNENIRFSGRDSKNIRANIFGFRKIGDKILRDFYRKNKGRKPLFHEKSFRFDFEDHMLRGVWDSVEERDSKRVIVDYKTDINSGMFYADRNVQFTIYSLAHLEEFGFKEDAILLYHLRSGKLLPTYRNDEDYRYLLKLLDDSKQRIENDEFVPFYGFHCESWCDYKNECEKYRLFGELSKNEKNRIDDIKFVLRGSHEAKQKERKNTKKLYFGMPLPKKKKKKKPVNKNQMTMDF